jgi:hypothetical protein
MPVVLSTRLLLPAISKPPWGPRLVSDRTRCGAKALQWLNTNRPDVRCWTLNAVTGYGRMGKLNELHR